MKFPRPLAFVTTVALASSLVFVTGCNKDEATAKSSTKSAKIVEIGDLAKLQPADFFPATSGAQGTFVTEGNNAQEFVLRYSKVVKNGDATSITMEVLQNRKVTDVSTYRADAKGITQTSARNGVAFNPPQSVLPFPIKKDMEFKEFKFAGTGPYTSVATGEPTSGKLEAVSRVRGVEVIDTELGKIEAVAVTSVSGYQAGKSIYRVRSTTWFAPKYGIVRVTQQIQRNDGANTSLILKLKNFSGK